MSRVECLLVPGNGHPCALDSPMQTGWRRAVWSGVQAGGLAVCESSGESSDGLVCSVTYMACSFKELTRRPLQRGRQLT